MKSKSWHAPLCGLYIPVGKHPSPEHWKARSHLARFFVYDCGGNYSPWTGHRREVCFMLAVISNYVQHEICCQHTSHHWQKPAYTLHSAQLETWTRVTKHPHLSLRMPTAAYNSLLWVGRWVHSTPSQLGKQAPFLSICSDSDCSGLNEKVPHKLT